MAWHPARKGPQEDRPSQVSQGVAFPDYCTESGSMPLRVSVQLREACSFLRLGHRAELTGGSPTALAARAWGPHDQGQKSRAGGGGAYILKPVPQAHGPSGEEAWPQPGSPRHSPGRGVEGLGGALMGTRGFVFHMPA